MDIEFVCEHCGKMLKVQEYLAGQTTDCYNCNQQVSVPQEASKAVIEFGCPGCGARFRVPSARAGSRTKCPKCQALLTVPSAAPAARPAAAQPAEPSGYALQGAPTPVRGRAAQPQQQADGKAVFVPKRSTTSMGMMFFWVGVGALLIIGLIMLAVRGGGPGGPGIGGSYEKLEVDPKFDGASNRLLITNTGRDAWTNVTVTIVSGGVKYSTTLESMTPTEQKAIEGDTLKGPAGGFTAPVYPFQLTVQAQLPSGRTGQFNRGFKAPKMRSPADEAPSKPKTSNKPADEGKVVD